MPSLEQRSEVVVDMYLNGRHVVYIVLAFDHAMTSSTYQAYLMMAEVDMNLLDGASAVAVEEDKMSEHSGAESAVQAVSGFVAPP